MEISDSLFKRTPVCIECLMSLACETDMIVNPRRCNRCKCVEATIESPHNGSYSIVLVERECPRVTWVKGTTGSGRGFYCVECAVLLSENPGLRGVS